VDSYINESDARIMFHIAVNLLYLRPGEVGGSEEYVKQLFGSLARNKDIRLTLFCFDMAEHAIRSAIRDADVKVLAKAPYSTGKRLRSENVLMPLLSKRHKFDVLVNPANFGSLHTFGLAPQVTVIHDLQHLHFPEFFSLKTRFARNHFIRKSVANSRYIIAISEFTRKDIVNHLGANPSDVQTIHEGVVITTPSLEKRRAVRKQYCLFEQYLIYPAMIAPHKNHEIIIRALSVLRKRLCRPMGLVFTGSNRAAFGSLEKIAERLGVGDSVRHLGHIPREDVIAVIAESKALVFPSLFEGFGQPVLEAQFLGVPVIVSNAASLPEVTGAGGVQLPPYSVQAWAEAISRVLDDELFRRGLIQSGIENVKRFSWEKCAEETLRVLRLAAKT